MLRWMVSNVEDWEQARELTRNELMYSSVDQGLGERGTRCGGGDQEEEIRGERGWGEERGRRGEEGREPPLKTRDFPGKRDLPNDDVKGTGIFLSYLQAKESEWTLDVCRLDTPLARRSWAASRALVTNVRANMRSIRGVLQCSAVIRSCLPRKE